MLSAGAISMKTDTDYVRTQESNGLQIVRKQDSKPPWIKYLKGKRSGGEMEDSQRSLTVMNQGTPKGVQEGSEDLTYSMHFTAQFKNLMSNGEHQVPLQIGSEIDPNFSIPDDNINPIHYQTNIIITSEEDELKSEDTGKDLTMRNKMQFYNQDGQSYEMRLFDVQESELLQPDGVIFTDHSEEQSFAVKVKKEILLLRNELQSELSYLNVAANAHREESKRSSVIEEVQYNIDIPIPQLRPHLEISNTLKQSLMSDGSSRNASHLTDTLSSKRIGYTAKELAKGYFLGFKVRKILSGRRLKKLTSSIKILTNEYFCMRADGG